MSTRGLIARPKGDSFEGIYQHTDSYPTELGRELWEDARAILHAEEAGLQQGGLARLLAYAIDEHRGGWSSWFDRRCYCHWEGRENDAPMIHDGHAMTSDDWLSIEWVYVIHAESRTFSVIRGCVRVGELNDGSGMGVYSFRPVGAFSLDGPEPDWGVLECGADLSYCSHVEGYHQRGAAA